MFGYGDCANNAEHYGREAEREGAETPLGSQNLALAQVYSNLALAAAIRELVAEQQLQRSSDDTDG